MAKGFYDLPVGEKYIERPFGMRDFVEQKCLTELPPWAFTGWRLVALVSPTRERVWDPFVLYNRWGDILHVWDQVYPPSYAEVVEVCSRLLGKCG